MKTKIFNKKLLVSLSIVLIAVMALLIAGCANNSKDDSATTTESTTDATAQAVTEKPSVIYKGEGEKTFIFIVTDADGKNTHFMIKTDKETVGEALLDEGLISGENGEFGLYVKTVNGITYDFDKDGKYWAFYEENTYASKGVDQTPITEGAVYSFRVE